MFSLIGTYLIVAESDVDLTDIRYYAVVSVRKSKSSSLAGSLNLNKSHSHVAYGGWSKATSSKGGDKSSGSISLLTTMVLTVLI